MQLANRKIKVCFPSLNIFGIKTKVKIVKKYLQLMNVFHCLGFICLYEKTHKYASSLKKF